MPHLMREVKFFLSVELGINKCWITVDIYTIVLEYVAKAKKTTGELKTHIHIPEKECISQKICWSAVEA